MQFTNDNDLIIRPAEPGDVPLILALIRELADYEGLTYEVTANEETTAKYLFGPASVAKAVIAEYQGNPAGFALYFHNFSTFLGRPGFYLEDLFVRSDFRRQGIGKALLVHLARLARSQNCGRLEWAVLNWNEPAIRFYRSLQAAAMDEWTVYRLTGDALDQLADQCRDSDSQPERGCATINSHRGGAMQRKREKQKP